MMIVRLCLDCLIDTIAAVGAVGTLRSKRKEVCHRGQLGWRADRSKLVA